MPSLNDVEIRITTKSDNSGIRSAESATTNLGSVLTKVGGIVAGLKIGQTILDWGKSAVMMAGQMEQSNIAFTTLLKDGEKARLFLEDLKDFAARTPFEFQGLQDSSRKLLAFGFEAEKILPMMTAIGDTVSALGGGAPQIEAVTRAIGQMNAKGKLATQEMNQLNEVGIPSWELLAEKIGVSIPEAMEMVEARAIDSSVAIESLLAGMTERFGGAMEVQSQTMLGKLSTLKDEVSFVAIDIGEKLINAFKIEEAIDLASAKVGELKFALGDENSGLKKAIDDVKLAFQVVKDFFDPVLSAAIETLKAAWMQLEVAVLQLTGGNLDLVDILQFLAIILGGILFSAILGIIAIVWVVVKVITVWIEIIKNVVDAIKFLIKVLKEAVEWIDKFMRKLMGLPDKKTVSIDFQTPTNMSIAPNMSTAFGMSSVPQNTGGFSTEMGLKNMSSIPKNMSVVQNNNIYNQVDMDSALRDLGWAMSKQ